MGMDQRFEMRRDYLYVQLTGDFEIDEAIRLYSIVQKEADLHGATRVLIDCLQLEGNPDITDRYRYGKFVAEQQHDNALRRSRITAYVGLEPPFDERRFGEVVATNRSARIKRLDRTEDALKWLGVDSPSDSRAVAS
jgi:hypothetical protein